MTMKLQRFMAISQWEDCVTKEETLDGVVVQKLESRFEIVWAVDEKEKTV